MGLDMYLKASKYVGGWSHGSRGEKKMFKSVLNAIGLGSVRCESSPSLTVEVTVAYWRKVNAIHKWFVDNTQNGKDECQSSYVSREQLKDLLALCHQALMDKDASLLPPESGFFFGSTAVDEWYWEGIKETIEQLTAILWNDALEDCDFLYQASW